MAKQLEILHLATGYTPVLPDSIRSVEGSLYQLTKEQAKLGHNVTVVDIKSPNRNKTEVSFYEVWHLPLTGSNLLSYFLGVIIFTLQLPIALYRSKNADVIHTHSQFPTALVIIYKKLFRLKAKIFYTAHSPYLTMPLSLGNRLKHTLIEGWALRNVDRIVVQTKSVGEKITQRFGVNPNKIIQVSDGVDIEEIKEFIKYHFKNHSEKVVIYPAYINHRKNQMALVKAIPLVLQTEPECKFIFPGAVEDKNYYTEIQEFLTAQGINNAQFVGRTPRVELYELYHNASMLVFPTLFETQGIILLEAMAFGIPVIASNIKAIQDIVELEEDCALLVNPQDYNEIGQAIIRLLESRFLRSKLSAKGKKLVYSRFGWDKIAQNMAGEYDKASK